MSEEQQIATLLGAVKGDLQKQLYSELQRKRTSESKLSLSDFREILIKVTKKSSSEYSRILDKLRFTGDISVRDVYSQIYCLVKKLLKNGTDSM